MKLYTAKELKELAGISPGTLRNFVLAGLPVSGTRKSRRGKPLNLYDPGAIAEWWEHRLLAGKWNWTASKNISNLRKLAGIKGKPDKPLAADNSQLTAGLDITLPDFDLSELLKDLPQMEMPEIELLELSPIEMTKEEAERAFNIRIVEKGAGT